MGPVIRSNKGEHKAVLEEIQRGGFVRVRIDGDIYPVEESLNRNLDRQKKHNIEVVVDRLVLDKDLDRSRLVDSLEIALRLGKGIVIVTANIKEALRRGSGQKKQNQNDFIFSEHFACEDCGISLPELEPRIFSFNNPYGACPECAGLGEKLEVDPELIMPNKNLTLAEGAIWPWSRASHKVGRQGYFASKIFELAQKHNFSVDQGKKKKNLTKKIFYFIVGRKKGGGGVAKKK